MTPRPRDPTLPRAGEIKRRGDDADFLCADARRSHRRGGLDGRRRMRAHRRRRQIRGVHDRRPRAPRLIIVAPRHRPARRGVRRHRRDGGYRTVESLAAGGCHFAVEVIGFSEERGSALASVHRHRAVTGSAGHDLMARVDAAGISLGEASDGSGARSSALRRSIGDRALGYVEFNIEQGPGSDRLGLPLGIVSAIAGRPGRIPLHGSPDSRHDAMPRERPLAGAPSGCSRRTGRDGHGRDCCHGRPHRGPARCWHVIAGDCLASLDVRQVDSVARRRDRTTAEGRKEISTRRGWGITWRRELTCVVTMDPGWSPR